MHSALSDSLLSCFTNNGAHLRTLVLVGDERYDDALAIAAQCLNADRTLVRIPQHLTLIEAEEFFKHYPSHRFIYLLTRIESRSTQLTARVLREVRMNDGLLIGVIYPNDFQLLRLFANCIDVIDIECDTPEIDVAEFQSLCASSSVDRIITLMRRSGCDESMILHHVAFPQMLLRDIFPVQQEQQASPEQEVERGNAREGETVAAHEKVFDEKKQEIAPLERFVQQEKKYQTTPVNLADQEARLSAAGHTPRAECRLEISGKEGSLSIIH